MEKLTKTLFALLLLILSTQLYSQTEGTVVLSVDKNNVFYIGIDNPVYISVPGVSNDKLRVSIKNGTLLKNEDKYIVKVDNVGEAVITVATEVKQGMIKSAGSFNFKIKKIPEPRAYIGNQRIKDSILYISKEDLTKDPTLNVSSDLPFEYNYTVVSFNLCYKLSGDFISEASVGNKLSGKQLERINSKKELNKIFIEDIKVKCPDGSIRMIPGLIIKFVENK